MKIIIVASGKKVPLWAFIKAVKFAINHPDYQFNEGLTCWWPCTGKEIRAQFLASVHDRINQAIPYNQRNGLC